MFTVIFEVVPKAERFDEYLALAASLRPAIEAIDGFIANERYRSRPHPEKLVSLSDWRDEKALVRWRTLGEHHAAQERGRFEIFADYHLRVGEVVAGGGGQRIDETETGAAKLVSLTEFSGGGAIAPPTGALAPELFESIVRPSEMVLLAGWRDRGEAVWQPAGASRHRLVRVIRDYGLRDRREAPQYYPPVAGV